jgi:ribonuclease BN (tRNA processing enzyme)
VKASGPAGTAAAPPSPLRPSYVHTDPFSVITVGTASPNTTLTRASSCTMVQHNGKYYTVDAGTGCIYGFMRAAKDINGTTEFALRDIRAMFFSHLHQDHSTSYCDIVTPRWMQGGGEMLLAGPWQTGLLHDHLLTFYRDDLVYRLLRKVAENRLPVEEAENGMFSGVTVKEMVDPESFEYDGLNIQTAVLTHTMYNLAYRFEVDGHSIVVSGDTSYDENLVTLAKGADILVLDGEGWNPDGNQPFPLDWQKLPPKYWPEGKWGGNIKVLPHMSFDDMARTISRANPAKVVLTHFRPGTPDPSFLQAEAAKAGFTGTIVVANDGDEFVPG